MVTNNNIAYQSGAVTKFGNAQRVAVNQRELQTQGTKLQVKVPRHGRIGTCLKPNSFDVRHTKSALIIQTGKTGLGIIAVFSRTSAINYGYRGN